VKKIYLYAAALSLVNIACNSDELIREDSAVRMVYKTISPSSLTGMIQAIEKDCQDIKGTDVQSIINATESKAFQNKAFEELARKGYSKPTVSDQSYISETNTAEIINRLSYSVTVKSYLYAMLIDSQKFSDDYFNSVTLSGYERELLETVKVLSDNGGNDNDDDNGGIRPIAFAYGYQTSLANAVMMTVMSAVVQ